jgi:hypothetical protein
MMGVVPLVQKGFVGALPLIPPFRLVKQMMELGRQRSPVL